MLGGHSTKGTADPPGGRLALLVNGQGAVAIKGSALWEN